MWGKPLIVDWGRSAWAGHGGPVKVVCWNLERKKPSTPTGAVAVKRIAAEAPDVVVVTEARIGHLDSLGGYELSPKRPVGERFADDERKVLVWSRNPWRDVDLVGDPELPGPRFVAATTDTPIGEVRVIGVCIPWHMCDVRTGAKDKRPWEQHQRWLELFEPLIGADTQRLPTIIAGDFNQRVPRRKGGRRDVAEQLAAVLADFHIVTESVPPGCERQGIDHIALGPGLRSIDVRGWPNDDGGVRMSDRDAAVAELRLVR